MSFLSAPSSPLSLPQSLQLSFLAEGRANIVYRIHLPLPTPPLSSSFSSSADEYGPSTPPPTEIDFPSPTPDWTHILKNKLLRLRKALPTATRIQDAQAHYDGVIKPIFEPEHLVAQEVVILPPGLVDRCNAELRAMETEGKRQEVRKGSWLDESSVEGLLVQDMSAEGWEGEDEVVCLEFKPKWLAQAPDTPKEARRCRTCALRDMRLAERGPERGSGSQGWCPLDLVSGEKSRIGRAVEGILSTSEQGSDNDLDGVLKERVEDWVLHSELLQRLRDAQLRYDQKGLKDGGMAGKKYRTAMTLRDCTLFLRMSKDGKGQVEARLGDLDLKPASKVEYWEKIERRLREEDWYAAEGGESTAGSTVCFLARSR